MHSGDTARARKSRQYLPVCGWLVSWSKAVVEGEQAHEEQARQESTHVREPGDSLALRSDRERAQAADELNGKPIQKHERGGQLQRGDEDEENQSNHSSARVQVQEGAHDTLDSAACSH